MAGPTFGTVELDPNGYDLILRFSYDKLLVEEIKTELPNRRWDPGAKAWRVPAKDVDRVYALCLKHGFEFSGDVSGLLAGTVIAKEPPPRETARKAGGTQSPNTKAPKAVAADDDDDGPQAVADADGQHLLLRFPYDEAMVAAVRELEGRRWDRKARLWRVPVDCPGLRAFLATHDFEVADPVAALLPPDPAAGGTDDEG